MKKLVLRNNGIGDADLAAVLEGVKENSDLKSLDIVKNEIGAKSSEMLIQLLTRETPLQLGELSIRKSKGSPLQLNRILEAMAIGCRLKQLSLSDTGLNDHSFSLVEDFVVCNPSL